MKNFICILAITAISVVGLNAGNPVPEPQAPQGPEEQNHVGRSSEEIRSMKVAFMTSAMGLTTHESQVFWPVYNKYWGEKGKIAKARRELVRKIEKEPATDSQLNELIRLLRAEIDVWERYIPEFKSVLPVDKVAKIYTAEDGFKKYLLNLANERTGK